MSIETDSSRYKPDIKVALLRLQAQIRWKPGKDLQHLQTRIGYGHLPNSATLVEYEAIIDHIILDDEAEVYAYVWPDAVYATVVGKYAGRRWLVMCSLDGIMETAFPPLIQRNI